jgi:hypothetical protein
MQSWIAQSWIWQCRIVQCMNQTDASFQ